MISFRTWREFIIYLHILTGAISTLLPIWFVCELLITIFLRWRWKWRKWDAFSAFHSPLFSQIKKFYTKRIKKCAVYGDSTIAESTTRKWYAKLAIVENDQTEMLIRKNPGHMKWDIAKMNPKTVILRIWCFFFLRALSVKTGVKLRQVLFFPIGPT